MKTDTIDNSGNAKIGVKPIILMTDIKQCYLKIQMNFYEKREYLNIKKKKNQNLDFYIHIK